MIWTMGAVVLVTVNFVFLLWYAYNCGYHQGWTDSFDGRTMYRGEDAWRSLGIKRP